MIEEDAIELYSTYETRCNKEEAPITMTMPPDDNSNQARRPSGSSGFLSMATTIKSASADQPQQQNSAAGSTSEDKNRPQRPSRGRQQQQQQQQPPQPPPLRLDSKLAIGFGEKKASKKKSYLFCLPFVKNHRFFQFLSENLIFIQVSTNVY